MKKISVVIPTRNEELNIREMVDTIKKVFFEKLQNYDYEIIITDNKSSDGTRDIIQDICANDKKVKAIFNSSSFSYSSINAIVCSTGDCAILLCADFQDPPELIPDFVAKWEEGYDVVAGIKNESEEGFLMKFIRKTYYKVLTRISDQPLIEGFSTYALYDKKFVKTLSEVSDPLIYLRGLVVEMTDNIALLEYKKQARKKGRSNNNFMRLYDFAMRGITSYSKAPLRIASLLGGLGCVSSIIIGIVYLIRKIIYWHNLQTGIMPLIVLVILFGSLQLMMLGIIGEYIVNINIRVMNHPRIVEDCRINFD